MNHLSAFFLGLVTLTCFSESTCSLLRCYQCIKNSSEECGPETLLPCPTVADRCVTHISRNEKKGFLVKRECGLGPCGFEDDMVNKGLGMDGCDRSKEEYFCISCCRADGCNRNSTGQYLGVAWYILLISLFASLRHI